MRRRVLFYLALLGPIALVICYFLFAASTPLPRTGTKVMPVVIEYQNFSKSTFSASEVDPNPLNFSYSRDGLGRMWIEGLTPIDLTKTDGSGDLVFKISVLQNELEVKATASQIATNVNNGNTSQRLINWRVVMIENRPIDMAQVCVMVGVSGQVPQISANCKSEA